MILPCQHEERVVNQVQPAIDLLTNLDTIPDDRRSRRKTKTTKFERILVMQKV